MGILIALFPFFTKKKIALPIIYPFLGIVFYLSSKDLSSFVAVASLIFLFGIPSGTLSQLDEKGKLKKDFKELVFSLGFFICLILFFL